jgi:hypothetical protein
VDAARTVTQRRSLGLGAKWLTKGAILAVLVRQHVERYYRLQGAAADPRLSNPYFREWAEVVRNALMTLGVMPCAQKQ